MTLRHVHRSDWLRAGSCIKCKTLFLQSPSQASPSCKVVTHSLFYLAASFDSDSLFCQVVWFDCRSVVLKYFLSCPPNVPPPPMNLINTLLYRRLTCQWCHTYQSAGGRTSPAVSAALQSGPQFGRPESGDACSPGTRWRGWYSPHRSAEEDSLRRSRKVCH